MDKVLDVVIRESKDIEKEALVAAYSHYLASRRWDKVNIFLGLPTTILAAIAGITAFDDPDGHWLVAFPAILAAVLSAINTFLNPSARANSHMTAKTTFSEIRRQASLLSDVDVYMAKTSEEDSAQSLVAQLRELTAKMTEAEQKAPLVYSAAKEKAETKFSHKIK